MAETMLEVRGVTRQFGGLTAVDDVTFDLEGDTALGLIGANGAGKTTLFNCLTGFDRPTAGEVLLEGRSIGKMKRHQVVKAGMARTFQQIQLVPGMTVLENVLTGRHRHLRAGFVTGMLRLPGARREDRLARQRCLEVIDFLGLADCADSEAVSLAYGQQRRVELARALACEPSLLLLGSAYGVRRRRA